jgi:hypothetical protein
MVFFVVRFNHEETPMNTQHTTAMSEAIDDDLQALADEIAANTGVSAATALQLATTQRLALRQYAGRWNAAARRSRAAACASEETDRLTKPKH